MHFRILRAFLHPRKAGLPLLFRGCDVNPISPFKTSTFWKHCRIETPLSSVSFTCDSKTARIQHGVLCGCNVDLKAELLKGPAVCLCNILPCSSNVCLWYKQATEAHVDVLMEEGWGKRIAIITDITSSILIYVKNLPAAGTLCDC